MKKILSAILAAALTASALLLASCGGDAQGELDETNSVSVKIVDENGTIDKYTNVAVKDEISVLEATADACRILELNYEFDDTSAPTQFKSIENLVSLSFADDDSGFDWVYVVDGNDNYATGLMNPAEEMVKAGQEIVWTYCDVSEK